MGLRHLGVALLLAILAGSGPAHADDIQGWQGLTWGMNPAQVAAALPQAVKLVPPRDFGPFTAGWLMRDVVVGGIAFDMLPEIDRRSGRLAQILFERRPPIPGPSELQSFVNDLAARLGPPAEDCVDDAGVATQLWRLPSAQVVLTFVDFSADGSRGRLNRLLLRYTAADHAPPSPCERGKPRT